MNKHVGRISLRIRKSDREIGAFLQNLHPDEDVSDVIRRCLVVGIQEIGDQFTCERTQEKEASINQTTPKTTFSASKEEQKDLDAFEESKKAMTEQSILENTNLKPINRNTDDDNVAQQPLPKESLIQPIGEEDPVNTPAENSEAVEKTNKLINSMLNL